MSSLPSSDAITGDTARVCMVAAVHPSHAVESGSTLRYARQYSALQASTGGRATQLTAEVRELQRRVDRLKNQFEKALTADDDGVGWTRESLQGSKHCQAKRNAKEFFEGHPYLCWTQAHQSKASVRGQRRDKSGICWIRSTVDIPPPRNPADKADGRMLNRPEVPPPRLAPVDGEKEGALGFERSVECIYEGRHGRADLVLWYVESGLEMVVPPRPLIEALEKLEKDEAEYGRKKAELQKLKDSASKKQEDWMATG
eukprot:TRINITY_DN13593_c0_g1_i1.p1 TRINITY_DN13593_c0_g1~~TRINITY_DN13593_c0_g1_i1.p1  ORF type:complete len:257 (+),score=54.46 TRINITY_DN13593_c0_g1_i1:25-795(+)